MSCCDSSPVIPDINDVDIPCGREKDSGPHAMSNFDTNSDTDTDQDDRCRMVHARKKAPKKINQEAVPDQGDVEICGLIRGVLTNKVLKADKGLHPLVEFAGFTESSEAYKVILTILTRNINSESIFLESVCCWKRLTTKTGGDVRARHGPITKKGYTALLKGLQQHSKNAVIAEAGVSLIRALVSTGNEDTIQLLVECEDYAITRVAIDLMRLHIDNVKLQVNACNIVHEIAHFDLDPMCNSSFWEAGACNRVIEAMGKHNKNNKMQVAGCAAIGHLFCRQWEDSDEGDLLCLYKPLTNLIVGAVECFPGKKRSKNDQVHRFAISALGNMMAAITFHWSTKDCGQVMPSAVAEFEYMMEKGVVKMTVDAIQYLPYHHGVQRHGVRVLDIALETGHVDDSQFDSITAAIIEATLRFGVKEPASHDTDHFQMVDYACMALAYMSSKTDGVMSSSVRHDDVKKIIERSLESSFVPVKVSAIKLACRADYTSDDIDRLVKDVGDVHLDDPRVQEVIQAYIDSKTKVKVSGGYICILLFLQFRSGFDIEYIYVSL
jgi:hypothetical protein